MNFCTDVLYCFRQLPRTHFLEHFEVTDYTFLVFSRRHSRDLMQCNSCELQPQRFPLGFVCIMGGWLNTTNKKRYEF